MEFSIIFPFILSTPVAQFVGPVALHLFSKAIHITRFHPFGWGIWYIIIDIIYVYVAGDYKIIGAKMLNCKYEELAHPVVLIWCVCIYISYIYREREGGFLKCGYPRRRMRSAGSAAQRISTGGDAGTQLDSRFFWRDFSRGIYWYLITKNYCSVNDFLKRKSRHFSVIPCFLIIPTWGNSTDSPLIFLTAWSLSVRFARGIWSWRNDNCKFCLVGEIQSQAGCALTDALTDCVHCAQKSTALGQHQQIPQGHRVITVYIYIYIYSIFFSAQLQFFPNEKITILPWWTQHAAPDPPLGNASRARWRQLLRPRRWITTWRRGNGDIEFLWAMLGGYIYIYIQIDR